MLRRQPAKRTRLRAGQPREAYGGFVREASGRSDPADDEWHVTVDRSHPTDRSLNPETCPFLRTVDRAALLRPPVEAPDPANRCTAVGAPTPQSARQQELVCLTSGHSNCPRYLRGELVAAEPVVRAAVQRGPSTPVIASALLLVAAAATSVGFLLVRGGLSIPTPSIAPGNVAAVIDSPAPPSAVAVVESPSADQADGDTDVDAIADGGADAHHCPDAGPDNRPDPRSHAGARADERSLRGSRPVSEHARLLDLHRPLRRQLREHRQLVRGPLRHGCADEPGDGRSDHDSGGRQDPHAAADPLSWPPSRSPSSRR